MSNVELYWYRWNRAADGKITVERVERRETDTSTTFYVLATNEVSAKLLGKEAFNTYYRERQREHRANLRAQGLCDCGRKVDTDGVTCSHCRKRSRVYDERAEAKKRGEVVPPLSRKVSREERRAGEREAFRAEVLRAVARDFKRLPKHQFEARLQEQIRGAADSPAPAPSSDERRAGRLEGLRTALRMACSASSLRELIARLQRECEALAGKDAA